jgi:uncharacterized protein YkwD
MTRVSRYLILFCALALVVPAASLANCGAAADRDPSGPSASIAAAKRATLCLLNAERRRHGLKRLHANRKLAVAGERHARDMVQKQYFSHDAPSGQNFAQRILKTSYVPANAAWNLGENLAWGGGHMGTPRAIVRAWMASPGHRANILSRAFREIGIGIVPGAPVGGGHRAATYATEFGRVRRH